jgi:hypothetical protein
MRIPPHSAFEGSTRSLFYEVVGHADLNVTINEIPCFLSLADEHPQARSYSEAADTSAYQFLRTTVV